MTLKELIPTLPDGFLYIGSGSCFFFVGERGEALQAVEKTSKDYHDWLLHTALPSYAGRMSYYTTKVGRLQAQINALSAKSPKQLSGEMLKERDKYIKTAKLDLERTQYRLRYCTIRSNELCQKLKDWVDLQDRAVKDHYPRITGGRAVVIEGTEMGSYWTYEETLKNPEPIRKNAEFGGR